MTSSEPRAAPAPAFPAADGPQLIRAQQKDELYLQQLIDACHDAVRRLLGPRQALRWAGETRLLAQLLFYGLTTGGGLQTPGEEYCDILQVVGEGPGALPGTARRGLLVLLLALGPYWADRLAAAAAQQEQEAGDAAGFAAWREAAQRSAPAAAAQQQDRQGQQQQRPLEGAADAGRQLWRAAQRAVQPAARQLVLLAALLREHGPTLLRIHLALFYIYGRYYQPSKRATGVHYLFLGRSLEGRPSYRILGLLLLSQLGISGLLWLLRRYGGSIPGLVAGQQGAAGRQLHAGLLAEDGKPLTGAGATANGAGEAAAAAVAAAAADGGREVPAGRNCPLCLSARVHPTATPCGHVFCWACITDWAGQKPECPLCRADFTPSSLVCVRHADF